MVSGAMRAVGTTTQRPPYFPSSTAGAGGARGHAGSSEPCGAVSSGGRDTVLNGRFLNQSFTK